MDSSSDPRDRRVFPRATAELDVEYKRLNTFFHDYTRNISKGGTFIKTDRPLEVGTEFVFKLTIPELLEPLALLGRVVWVVTEEEAAQDPEAPAPGMGIEFLYETEDDRLYVESTVERLMKKHLGELAVAKLMNRA